ncbi:uncharacterized protein L201_002864 [Kwoniella dendrophila CBS 6074]|uniref:DNA (cytosine-5-)-methyltransferase n=1 Tax=Kwoniella dendrophila CBS 6074 TaxID=1295534 RepID=A0AAX4JRE4_9TREE
MSSSNISQDVIELEDSGSDSDFEIVESDFQIIDRENVSNPDPRLNNQQRKTRKVEHYEEISDSDEDIRSDFRELSVQPSTRHDSVSDKGKRKAADQSASHYTPSTQSSPTKRSRHAKYSSQSNLNITTETVTNSRLSWIQGESFDLPEKTTFELHGKEEKCVKISRNGFEYNGMTYKRDDAVMLSAKPPQHVLLCSFFTIKFDNSDIHDRHYVHGHFLKFPTIKSVSGNRDDELFLRHGQCQSIHLKVVIKGRKLDFEMIGGKGGRRRGDTKYFCQFVDQPLHSTIREPILEDRFNNCDSCRSRHEKHKYDKPHTANNILHFGDEDFHINEFVFIDPKIKGGPYMIGHLQDWSKNEGQVDIKVRRLKRYREVKRSDVTTGFMSERHLIAMDTIESYPVSHIIGKAYVYPSEDIPKNSENSPNSFWCSERSVSNGTSLNIVPLQKPLKTCSECMHTKKRYQQDLQDCIQACKFPAADYFSGAGGFILPGIEIFDWKSANDIEETACSTLHGLKHFARNLIVHQGKLSDLLKYTINKGSPTNNPIALPVPGSIFMMSGGPPCQGHSRINHANNIVPDDVFKSKDPRNDEVYYMLSEVSRLQPYVVIIENVAAFKDDKVSVGQLKEGEDNYGRGTMKELAKMGYSCRLSLVDSRSYGTPQNRQRIFIIGVKSGLVLPHFPDPSHTNPRVTATIFSNNKDDVIKPFYIGQRNTPGTGIHPARTIYAAISDLPSFEYLPPPGHSRTPRRPQIPAFNGKRDSLAGNNTRIGPGTSISYASEAQNDFQRAKRGNLRKVKDHYTSYCTEGALSIIFDKSRQPNPPGCNRRAGIDEGFNTLLTSSTPGGKGTGVIHPSQDRKFTVAERKRAMGWPDWHVLAGTPLDQDRQTGNGVCFESVQAIYLEIVKEIILPWWLKAGKPSQNVFQKFKEEHP